MRRGFTLLETLVALALLLAFAATLVPFLYQARSIMISADDRVAAQALLRALLEDPVDPATLADLSRDGDSGGLHWHLGAEPSGIVAAFPQRPAPVSAAAATKPPSRPPLIAYRVVATVTFGAGRSISGETVRLGNAE
jgi:prepilin-type N-terminal cleavage/methylation domain-containing protein